MKTSVEGKEILHLIEQLHPILAGERKEVAIMACLSEAIAIRNPHMPHPYFKQCLGEAYEAIMMIADTAGAKVQ